MSERYWITGVQLGLLKTVKTPLASRLDIVEKIIDKQFIGNFRTEKEQKEFKHFMDIHMEVVEILKKKKGKE